VSDVSQQAGQGDLLVNNLLYKQPKALSLAVNRTYHRQWFQRDQYSAGSTAIIDWNTGTSYVNCANSYLIFKVLLVTTVTATTGNFASGSATNLIREVKVRSRSGTELDRTERLNLYEKVNNRYTFTESYLQKFGSVMGFGDVSRDGTSDAAILNDVTATTFIIPLKCLGGVFRPIKGQLMPPQLASGLHCEISFETAARALFLKVQGSGTGVITGYTISDIQMMLDSTEMSDDTQKTINMESASNGLEYSYPRIYTAVTSHPSAQTTVSIQVRKAVSQASVATTVVLSQADQTDFTADSMASVDWDTTQWYYRLGALYFPHQRISDEAKDGKESYIQAQMTYDKLKHPFSESSVDVADFKTGGDGAMCASFGKDTGLNLSGLPINNSRILEVQATFDTFTGAREIVTYLEYIAVSRSWIDQVSVAL